MPETFREITGVDVYTSSPYQRALTNEQYLARLRTVSRWSDTYGCRGMLIYTDNRTLDPWVLAGDVIAHTTTLSPLIAIQPIYMHPYAAAQKIGAVAQLYGRSVDLNFVAGGLKFDLAALDDRLEHDARYERLAEYGAILSRLVRGERVTYQGRYHRVFGLKLDTEAPEWLLPRLTVSGSSPAGLRCAEVLGATAVMYPTPLPDAVGASGGTAPGEPGAHVPIGIRIGILARESAVDAWRIAAQRFPEDADGQARTQAAVQASDSSWLHQLATLSRDPGAIGDEVYWTGPFATGRSFCPYLVGSYDQVATYLADYLRRDARVIILDCPTEEDDLRHAVTVLRLCATLVVMRAREGAAMAGHPYRQATP
jgi:alkanesulfonate monooxygenase